MPFEALAGQSAGRCLTLNPGLQLTIVSTDQALLIGGGKYFFLHNSVHIKAVKMLNGTRTNIEIAEMIPCPGGALEILGFFDQLERMAICMESVSALEMGNALSYWQGQGYTLGRLEKLRTTFVAVDLLQDGLSGKLISKALKRAGIQLSSHSPAFHVVVTHDLFDPRLDDIAKKNLASKHPWLLVSPIGQTPLISPMFTSAEGPCLGCLQYWLRINQPVEEYIRRKRGHSALSPPREIEPTIRLFAELAAMAIGRIILDKENDVTRLQVLDAETSALTHHQIRKRPQCAICGNPEYMKELAYQPVTLNKVTKTVCIDGGFRHQSPKNTYARFKHLVNPVCGPVSQLGPMPSHHTSSRPVFVSGYRVCPKSDSVNGQSFQRVCAGKGQSADQARVSALFEAIERFSGVYQGDEAIISSSLKELGDRALSPNSLQMYSDKQHAAYARQQSENIEKPLHVTRKYEPEQIIDWTPAWSLSHNQRRFVPFTYCFSEVPAGIDSSFARHNGNGAASGTCLEEAILQGLFELIERDAVGIWWYNTISRPELNLVQLEDEYYLQMKLEYNQLGWDIWILDLTHDLRIPVYAALAQKNTEEKFCIGFGCHLDWRIALQRAMAELNQLFDPAGELRAPWDHQKLRSTVFLYPDNNAPQIPSSAYNASSNMLDDIKECMHRLHRAGLELVIVNKSRPDTEVHVAHVIVPGLRHFWPRFGNGRLYTVPVQIGWRNASLTEEELNEVPLLL